MPSRRRRGDRAAVLQPDGDDRRNRRSDIHHGKHQLDRRWNHDWRNDNVDDRNGFRHDRHNNYHDRNDRWGYDHRNLDIWHDRNLDNRRDRRYDHGHDRNLDNRNDYRHHWNLDNRNEHRDDDRRPLTDVAQEKGGPAVRAGPPL
jgi:hypothetical protein